MQSQPDLTHKEWALVLELLRGERDQLPPEIHHTDSPDLHEALQVRLGVVDRLVRRLARLIEPSRPDARTRRRLPDSAVTAQPARRGAGGRKPAATQ